MKKTLIITLALVFVLGLAGTAFANPYSDVPAGHWAYKAVNDLQKAGVMEGAGGKFMGNQTLTRYEIAAITARAMAKADKADAAAKATIDKLAVEFSKELNDLGVRVAKLEKNQSGIKFTGDARVRWVDADAANGNTDFAERVRLYMNAKVNEDITFTAKFMWANHTKFGNTDSGDVNMYDAYATHKNLLGEGSAVTLGRMSQAVGAMGYYLDSTGKFDGIQVVVPAGDVTITAVLADAGKYDSKSTAQVTDENVAIVKVDYKATSDLLLKGWYFNPASSDGKVWGAGFNYAIDKDWKLLGDFVKEDDGTETAKDTHVRVAYKGASGAVPGSWGAHLEYVKFEGTPLETGAMNGVEADTKFMAVQYSTALAKNVTFDAIYAFDRKVVSTGKDATSKDFTRLQVNYAF